MVRRERLWAAYGAFDAHCAQLGAQCGGARHVHSEYVPVEFVQVELLVIRDLTIINIYYYYILTYTCAHYM